MTFINWNWTLIGIIYIGWTLGHFVMLRELNQGIEWVLLALFCTFACDTSAFFIGRAWGRHPMAPYISPNKTWEGAAAGFIAAIAMAFIINSIMSEITLGFPLGAGQIALIGGLVGIFVQLGDLWESWLKRKAGVKDSGNWIPGHGGMLDRFDGIIFAGVTVYYYVAWVID